MKIKIANKFVGDNSPVFIVAEGGINHNGSISIAKKIILEAVNAGADAIKFQTFKAADLTSTKSKYYNIFKRLEFGADEFGELSDYAKSMKIIFLSTPFSDDAVDLLSSINVPAFKIASGDLTNIPLIKYAASKMKPMIISTGMATMKDTELAVKAIKSKGNNKIILLHSVSSYPPPLNEANLLSIKEISKKFSYPVGYSDNGEDMIVPLIAVACGAKIIEKHFTINKKLKGPDQKLSANPIQFKNLIKEIRLVEKMLGDGQKRCQASELDSRINARRGVTAKITIEKGTRIKNEMLALKRPAIGIEPRYLNKIIGKITRKRILNDEPIKWKDLR